MILKSGEEQIIKLLLAIYKKETQIVSALTDLQGAIGTLGSNVSAELAAIAAKLASFGDSVSATDVENAVAQINSISAQVAAETTALTGTGTGT